MKQKFYTIISVLTIACSLFSFSSNSQSLIPGVYSGAVEQLIGVNYKNARPSTENQTSANSTGIVDLTTNRNGNSTRSDISFAYGNSGTYNFTISYSLSTNSFYSTTYIGSIGRTNTLNDVSENLIADGKVATPDLINYLQLNINTSNNTSTISVSNLTIQGQPVAGVFERSNNLGQESWYLQSSALNYGFTISGTVTFSGSFDNNEDGQRIQLTFGKTNTNFSSLPVIWGAFTSKRINSITNLLEWKTLAETNNSHYNVQRSTDGIHFTSIGKVAGNGNTSNTSDYSFEDKHATATVYYYRIQQVEYDNKINYSPIIKNGNGGKKTIAGITGGNTLLVQSFSGDLRQFRIINASGYIVKQFHSASAQQTIDMHMLPTGVYSLQIINKDGSAELFRFLK